MSKEKEYEELVSWIKEKRNKFPVDLMDIDDSVVLGEASAYQTILNKISELNKSNDEKIREEIAEFIFDKTDTEELRERSNKWLEWLEKQSPLFNEVEQRDVWEYLEKYNQNYSHYPTSADELTDVINWILKDQKTLKDSEEKLSSKFKVGDWIISHYSNVAYIKSIDEKNYILSCNNSNCERLSIDYVNRNWRLWTIEDAKPGDILACNEEISLFKSYSVQGRISLYCWYNGQTDNFHSIEVTDASLTTRNKIYPATKEQRYLLFQKMIDAGYMWDTEKLELIKVPKTKAPEGALKKLLDEQGAFYQEAEVVFSDKDTAASFLKRFGVIDENGYLTEKYMPENDTIF